VKKVKKKNHRKCRKKLFFQQSQIIFISIKSGVVQTRCNCHDLLRDYFVSKMNRKQYSNLKVVYVFIKSLAALLLIISMIVIFGVFVGGSVYIPDCPI